MRTTSDEAYEGIVSRMVRWYLNPLPEEIIADVKRMPVGIPERYPELEALRKAVLIDF